MNTDVIIEMAPFTVTSETTEAALLAASERLEREFLSKSDGYMGRALVRVDQDRWTDIVFWRTEGHVSKAMEAVASSEACRAYFDCMKAADHDDPHNGVSLFRAVRLYGSLKF